MNYSELIAKLITLSEMLDEYEGGNFKWSEEAATAREAADALQALDYDDSDTIPDNDKVICPSCCHQFQAIPASVQVRLQALERVPMTKIEVAKMARTMHTWPDKIEEVIRATEAHHVITPPESI